MNLKPLYASTLLALSIAVTCEAKDTLKMIDTIDKAPRCYVLSEFMGYYTEGWKDDLGTIYTNYSDASRFMQFMSMKAKKMNEASPEVISNTAAILFNQVTTEKRKPMIDMAIRMRGDSKRISILIGKLYDETGCSRFSKSIGMDEYNINAEISSIKSKNVFP